MIFQALNDDLRHYPNAPPGVKKTVLDRWRPLVCWMLRGIKKAPAYEGVLWRGISNVHMDHLEVRRPGES